MEAIKNFEELKIHLGNQDKRKKLAVANALDSHSLEAVVMAVEAGFIDAYLVGKRSGVEEILNREFPSKLPDIEPFLHIVDVEGAKEAAEAAVAMVRNGKCDLLMKGLVNTDVILRAILDKEKGIHSVGNVLTFTSCFDIPSYHKMIFMSDPAVIPEPTKEQRIMMIKYCIETAQKFGVSRPKIALIHSTEVANPKIRFMQDYLDIMELYRHGEFGDVIMDGPIDIFLAIDKERGEIKKIQTPVLGDSDILIFPDFSSANVFYKTAQTLGNAENAGLLYGANSPVVLTSRSDSTETKFYSICMACALV
ncbi:MAG: phosphate butyryltransferase [Prevotellaceae bacterium]|jgi:phosphate butyryltransferase|nr:phosphate butyryltransferase [Prevotellaceae bacterium]